MRPAFSFRMRSTELGLGLVIAHRFGKLAQA
jgi:hypothetical protein